jgi:uncharacterized protein (UPF0261 family)
VLSVSCTERVVAVLATLDTKRDEAVYLRDCLESRGCTTVVVDSQPRPASGAQSGATRLGHAARDSADRLAALSAERGLSAVVALGGGRGTALACEAMRTLPYELPKFMVTAARTDMLGPAVGATNIVLFPSVVDLNGLNRFTRRLLQQAAAAVAAIVASPAEVEERPRSLIAVSSFGVTTRAVTHARHLLEARAWEVVAFPATGTGGLAMERMVHEGRFAGVLDLSITELADEVVGGFATAGPKRLEAAGRIGLPQVVAPGAIDMVNFGAPSTVPERFRVRKLYRHGAMTTLMRTSVEENRQIGDLVGRKLALASGPTALLIPLRGFSAYDKQGEPFHDEMATVAFVDAVRMKLRDTNVRCEEIDCHINDDEFARRATAALVAFVEHETKRRVVHASA